MTSAARLSIVSSTDDIVVEDDGWPLIPERCYEAVYVGHRTALMFGRNPSVCVRFRLVTPGPHHGVELARYYRVARLTGNGKPREGGTFTLRRGSLLLIELCRLTEARLKPSRVSLSMLRGMVLEVSVRTVERAWDQRPLPEALRYSVVDELLGNTAGGAR